MKTLKSIKALALSTAMVLGATMVVHTPTAEAFNNWNTTSSQSCTPTNATSETRVIFNYDYLYNSSSSNAFVVCAHWRDTYSFVAGDNDDYMYVNAYVPAGGTLNCSWYVKDINGATYDSATNNYTNGGSSGVYTSRVSGYLRDVGNFYYYLTAVCTMSQNVRIYSSDTYQQTSIATDY